MDQTRILTKMINKMVKVVEKNVAELIMIAVFLIVMLSSCGTWKWVEPIPPWAANNHGTSKSICR